MGGAERGKTLLGGVEVQEREREGRDPFSARILEDPKAPWSNDKKGGRGGRKP